MTKAIVMKPVDNVATVVEEVNPGTEVTIAVAGDQQKIQVLEKIPFAHKFATRDIKKDEMIRKYGEVIGIATKDIKAGQHVHVHNLESTRGRGDK
ncbi:MAG: UxaA family hydrolase [Negativicutes bacterium]|nr:UxaA family hydrolase [Negativicutes bacterium]